MLNFSPPRCRSGRKPTGAKLALKPVHVWGIRVRLQVACKARDLALFDLALDSKLRGCDLVSLKVRDLLSAGGVKRRVVILQRKTNRPVQFEVTEQARLSIAHWIERKGLTAEHPAARELVWRDDSSPRIACASGQEERYIVRHKRQRSGNPRDR